MKKMLIAAALFITLKSSAQTKFVQAGKIEYERKINVHRQFEPEEDDSWFKEMISKMPKFHTTYFDLLFEGNHTIYKPGRESEDNKKLGNFWLIGPAKENIVSTQLDAKQVSSSKTVFEQRFLLQDTARNYEWRLSDETRTIAGFECRKAVTKICDSVYVVAFYTQEITVNGGPESFHGLPGMILGIAIPRLYTTWFATKVELVTPGASDFSMTTKGKKVTGNELQKTLQTSLKDWGKQGQRNIWWTVL